MTAQSESVKSDQPVYFTRKAYFLITQLSHTMQKCPEHIYTQQRSKPVCEFELLSTSVHACMVTVII